jgi:MFS family permease
MIKESTVATAEPEPKKPQTKVGMKDVLRNPDFLKLWVAQMLSQTAQQIVNFALLLQVERLTGSSTAVSGIIIAFTIPAILFSAIAGVFVERNSKKLMLVLTNVLRGVMVLAYILTDPAWGAGAVLPIFYVVTLLFAGVSQFFNPAEAAMIPKVVSKDELIAANSLFNLTLPATQLGGFVVLGPLLLNTVFHNNFNGLYILIFVLCIGAAFSTWLLPQDRPETTAAERRKKGEKVNVGGVAGGAADIARSGYREAGEELVEGWRFIRRDPVIMSAIIYWSVSIAVFMMLGTIGPGFLRVLGIDQTKLFYVLLPGGLGLVIGVMLVGRIARRENRESMINFSLLAAGVLLILFALIYPLLAWIYSTVAGTKPNELVVLTFLGALTLLLGLFNSFISVPAQTALQERSPEAIRARVFSAFFTISNAILLVPVFFAGALADWLGHTAAVCLIGIAVLLTAGLGLYRSRDRRAAERVAVAQDGHVSAEEAEAALTSASPAPRPIMAKEHQDTVGRED